MIKQAATVIGPELLAAKLREPIPRSEAQWWIALG